MSLTQFPVALHVWGVSREQRLAPGMHSPPHAPVLHAYWQVGPVPGHWPLDSQVSRSRPWQVVSPGEQTPVQLPSLHTWGQVELLTHDPVKLQLWGVSREQRT